MKTRKFIIATVWIGLASMVWSCTEDEPEINPEITQESLVKDNLLSGSNAAISRLKGHGFGGPMGAIFVKFAASTAGRTGMTPLSMMQTTRGRGANDSKNSADEKTDCLIETLEDDGDGTYTYTLDFGDGCDFYGEFMKGKMVETGTIGDASFTSHITYTNFGGEDWDTDGTQNYSGEWEEAEENPDDPADTTYNYAARYEFSADLNISYMQYEYDSDDKVAGEELIEMDYAAQGAESVDGSSYTVESRSESVSLNTGESFSSTVDAPLFMNFECEDVWVYVSGIESGSWSYEGQTGTYSINYGDGACDNIVTVTENGVSEEVDLGETFECGTGDHD